MKALKLLFVMCVAMALTGCKKSNNVNESDNPRKSEVVTPIPTICVYGMGNVPQKETVSLVRRLEKVYPSVKYCGNMDYIEKAAIVGYGNRHHEYWWKGMVSALKPMVNKKKEIRLIIMDGEVCSWNKKKNCPHQNLALSNLGGQITVVAYQRFKKNNLVSTDNLLKVAIHELGHSVAGLDKQHPEDGYHCSNPACLMKNAKNGFPYKDIKSFCPKCSMALTSKHFDLAKLDFK